MVVLFGLFQTIDQQCNVNIAVEGVIPTLTFFCRGITIKGPPDNLPYHVVVNQKTHKTDYSPSGRLATIAKEVVIELNKANLR